MSGMLDIDVILADEDRVPVEFLQRGIGLGMLDTTTIDSDIPEDTKLDLPLWLFKAFNEENEVKKKKGALMDVKLPSHYGAKMRDEIDAGAKVIRFREFSPYFFEVGIYLANLTEDEDLLRKLRKAFAGPRYENLTARALSTWNDDNLDYMNSLTITESRLLREGLVGVKELTKWKTGEAGMVETSITGTETLSKQSKRRKIS